MYCSNCGCFLTLDMVFCPQCGAQILFFRPANQQPYGAYGWGGMPVQQAPPSPPVNGMSVASLVLGILSWIFLPFIGAIIGLALGIAARSKRKDDGMALAGVVLSTVHLALVAGIFLFYIFCFFLLIAMV